MDACKQKNQPDYDEGSCEKALITEDLSTEGWHASNCARLSWVTILIIGLLILSIAIFGATLFILWRPMAKLMVQTQEWHYSKSVYVCSSDLATERGLKSCCGQKPWQFGVYDIRNTFGGRTTCGRLDCYIQVYHQQSCHGRRSGKIAMPTLGTVASLAQGDQITHLLKEAVYYCQTNLSSFEGIGDCCAYINITSGAHMVHSRYAGKSTCGFLNCSSRIYTHGSCQREDFEGNAVRFQTWPFLRASRTRTSSEWRFLVDTTTFPDPEELDSQPVLGPAFSTPWPSPPPVTNVASTSAESAQRKHVAKQEEQSECAGNILKAVITASALGMQISSSTRMCDDRTWVDESDHESREIERSDCSVAIFSIMENLAKMSNSGITAAGVCGQPDRGSPCGEALSDILVKTTDIGVAGSLMKRDCSTQLGGIPGAINEFSCAGDLAWISYDLPYWVGDFSKAARVCPKGIADPEPDLDYGLCLGNVLSTMAYISSAALMYKYLVDSCRKRRYEDSQRCGITWTAAEKNMALAASQANLAAGYCGGFNMGCGSDASQIAAYLFDFMNKLINAIDSCNQVTKYLSQTGLTPSDLSFVPRYADDNLCAAAVAGVAQSAGKMAKYGASMGESCAPTDAHDDSAECGVGVSNAFAAFAKVANVIALEAYNCNLHEGSFNAWKCASNEQDLGTYAKVVSTAIGKAVEHCPFAHDR